ncbi:substrate-binding domain-containing protein [Enterococcus sp. BWB1-3]|uniref:LacI family DNA-binding transcriptional regulator n=1 Tax=unclassified Enterococcus TaxID=2608891 RepID=UPI001922CBE9|nr:MULTISPECIES: LacI family DNA-binding transcriptional regulator [unclassified Enterococcus]MBL1228081.1 substrate-binding domain-containing protein [Enterococcus sp. BWB1-3]MCB5954102.1 substrate-binding domain-containing protein [Enterococcus sp. CWB-B31]
MKQPLYKLIYGDLRKLIETGSLAPESKVPTEMELSEKYQVSRITSKRALTELENEGYIYREQGRGSFVKNRKSKTEQTGKILFILPFANDLSLGNFNEGIYPVIQKHGFELLMTPSDYLEQHTAQMIIKEFDGLIYYAVNTETQLDLLFELSVLEFPVVTLDKKLYDFSFPAVLSDNFQGGQLAAGHLIESGHQRIGYIFGEIHHPQTVRQRYLGYVDALNKKDLTFRTKLNDTEAAISTAVEYIRSNQLTAAVCENDLIAIELMRQLKQADYQIPADFSVIGFDDIQAASLVEPPLTTVAQDFAELGQLAGSKIVALIQNQTTPDEKVPVKLILRQSTINE